MLHISMCLVTVFGFLALFSVSRMRKTHMSDLSEVACLEMVGRYLFVISFK